MTLKAILFMIFIATVCLGGFVYTLYLKYKQK